MYNTGSLTLLYEREFGPFRCSTELFGDRPSFCIISLVMCALDSDNELSGMVRVCIYDSGIRILCDVQDEAKQ